MVNWFSRKPVVPVLRLAGAIGMATPLRPGLSLATAAGPIARAIKAAKNDRLAIVINSPGGSPVQSRLIFQRIRDLAKEKKKTVHVFAEDLAASGGYMLALAGDEIYADPTSVVGSIGVISAGFGFDKLLERIGVDRRVYTAGNEKQILDPFQPERESDLARLRQIQLDVHTVFKDMVRERRGDRLKAADADVFEGQIFLGTEALKLGLIDGLGDVRTRMREVMGDEVSLRLIPFERSFFRRVGRATAPNPLSGLGFDVAAPDIMGDVLSTLEARALWARYGF